MEGREPKKGARKPPKNMQEYLTVSLGVSFKSTVHQTARLCVSRALLTHSVSDCPLLHTSVHTQALQSMEASAPTEGLTYSNAAVPASWLPSTTAGDERRPRPPSRNVSSSQLSVPATPQPPPSRDASASQLSSTTAVELTPQPPLSDAPASQLTSTAAGAAPTPRPPSRDAPASRPHAPVPRLLISSAGASPAAEP